MKILVVVDMQNDFVSGPLGTPEAKLIVDPLVKYVRDFDGLILVTQDTHFQISYRKHGEGNLPKHCIRDTYGWQLVNGLKELVCENSYTVFTKRTFGSFDLADYIRVKCRVEEVESVTLIGVCTDVCIIANALMIQSMIPGIPINVIRELVAGTNPELNKEALDVMKSCHINII